MASLPPRPGQTAATRRAIGRKAIGRKAGSMPTYRSTGTLNWLFSFLLHSALLPLAPVFFLIWAIAPWESSSKRSYYRLMLCLLLPFVGLIALAPFLSARLDVGEATPDFHSVLEGEVTAGRAALEVLRTEGTMAYLQHQSARQEQFEDFEDLALPVPLPTDRKPETPAPRVEISLGYRDFALADGSKLRAHLIACDANTADLYLASGTREQRRLEAFAETDRAYLEAVATAQEAGAEIGGAD